MPAVQVCCHLQPMMEVRTFRVEEAEASFRVEAVCIRCGADLVVVVGGGERYHVGATALSITLPSIKDPEALTHSSYLTPVPGHKEEDLAREGSLRLAKGLSTNVVMTVGIHEDNLSPEGIRRYIAQFNRLIDIILDAYA